MSKLLEQLEPLRKMDLYEDLEEVYEWSRKNLKPINFKTDPYFEPSVGYHLLGLLGENGEYMVYINAWTLVVSRADEFRDGVIKEDE